MRTIGTAVFATAMILSGTALAGGSYGSHWNHGGGHGSGHHARGISLELLGTFKNGDFGDSAAEIPAYDARSRRLFVVNADDDVVDILDLSDPANIIRTDQIETDGSPNSVAVHKGLVAVALEAEEKTDPGTVAFYDTDGTLLKTVSVGALPDMVTFTHDGRTLLVANEGEPNDDYTVDPEGSVSLIRLGRGLDHATVETAGFGAFNDKKAALVDAGVRIFGPDVTTADPDDTVSVAQDLEPEYIATVPHSRFAWVSLQENNAFAVIDIWRGAIVEIQPLGLKDHSLARNALDASDRDGGVNIQPWPVLGMYMPDAIAAYRVRGRTYIVSANEGDARDYDALEEEERIKDLTLDPLAFPGAAALQEDDAIGRLEISTIGGDTDGDGDFDRLHAFGARSFTIWNSDGRLVWDSGDAFERITAEAFPDDFNSDNDENGSADSRSDAKGPEPEGVTIAQVYGRDYAFIGLERVGGIVVYDISNPRRPEFVDYVNNRDFSGDPEADTAGDLGPEGLIVIDAKDSPTRRPLLVVANEVSGTTSVYSIDPVKRRRTAKR